MRRSKDKSIIFHAVILSLCVILFNGCEGPESNQVVPPLEIARARAQRFEQAHPDSRIYFSPTTGQILGVEAGVGEEFSASRAVTRAEALSAIQEFIQAESDLFGIDDPSTEVMAATGGFDLRLAPAIRGSFLSLRFDQYFDSTRVRNRYGVALFNGSGHLVALTSRLARTQELRARMGANTSLGAAQVPLLSALPTGPTRPRLLPGLRELPLSPVLEIDLHTGLLRRQFEEVRKEGLITHRLRYNDEGNLIEHREEMPSEMTVGPTDWATAAISFETTAPDHFSESVALRNSQLGGAPALQLMAFRLEDVHAPDQGVSIGDSSQLPDRSFVQRLPLATTARAWFEEPEYVDDLRDATGLAAHLRTTLEYFQRELGLRSWNDRGSAFYAAIRGRSRAHADEPDTNAFGANGMMLIGDGRTDGVLSAGDALEIVAHEFFHSVISAFPDFQ